MSPFVTGILQNVCGLIVLGLAVVTTGYLFGLGFHTAHKHIFRWEVAELTETVEFKEGGKKDE